MKSIQIILCSILCITMIKVGAQITYSSSDFMQIEDSMLFSQQTADLNFLNFDTTGANIFWDYSEMGYQNQAIKSYFDPGTSGYQTIWCANNNYGPFLCPGNFENLTNLAIQSLDSLSLGQISISNRISHQLISGNVLQDRMIGITAEISGIPLPFAFEYQNADSIYQFPFQYNTADSSISRILIDLSPAPVVQSRNAKRVNQIDGWGSLSTPYGTFPNVLKMRTTIERNDTLFLDTIVIPSNATLIEYKWWDLNYGLPVLIASGTLIGQTPVVSSVEYLDSARCVQPQSLFTYSPLVPVLDSVSQSVEIDFNNLSSNADSVLWDLGDGTITNVYAPSHTYFCPGVKNIRLVTFNTCEAELFSDTLNLFLFISDSTSNFTLDTLSIAVCEGDSILINGDYYNSPGVYLDVNTGSNGCDSTNVIQVEITPLPDTSVNVQLNTFTAAESLTYQWLDCNTGFSPIDGATEQQFIPGVSSGSYAVQVTNNEGCSAVSSCYEVSLPLGLTFTSSPKLLIYPNPAKDQITILENDDQNQTYLIYSLTGTELIRTATKAISLNGLDAGTYMLRAVDAKGNLSHRLFQKIL